MSIKKKYKSLGKGGIGDMPQGMPVMPQGMPAMPEGIQAMPQGMTQGMPEMQGPSAVAPGQDVGSDAKARLATMIENLKNKQGQMNAMKFGESNKVESQRQKALMEVFSMMQDAGIDPSNIEEVKAFLDELEVSNPEVYKAFVAAFGLLMGQQGGQSALPITGGAISQLGAQSQGTEGSGQIAPPDQGGIMGMFPGLTK